MANLSSREIELIIRSVRSEYLKLEENGDHGSDDHRLLREVEDKLGALQENDRYSIKPYSP